MAAERGPEQRRVRGDPVWWLAAALATGLGSGFCPVAPATLGSAVALGIYWLVPLSGDSPGLFALIAAGLAVGPLAINRILSAGETDPSRAVWDEFVGMWTACLYLPKEWPWLLAAFFTFRALDIAKPLGVRRFERLPGGLGVMADDLVAGFVAAGILNAIRLAFFA